MIKKEKYSAEDKLNYHQSRLSSPLKHGITRSSTKHFYSEGFVDGLTRNKPLKGLVKECGKARGSSYYLGFYNAKKLKN